MSVPESQEHRIARFVGEQQMFAAMLRGHYEALLAADFTEDQALTLTASYQAGLFQDSNDTEHGEPTQ